MLEQARDYEVRAIRLQNEINDHRNQLLREKQEILDVNIRQKEAFRRKLKKREAKVEKYSLINQQLTKEKGELIVRMEDSQQKLISLRLKMESKVQEKEFKIITLKNQMKQMGSINTGTVTPVASTMNQQVLQNVYSQNELFSMINNIVHQQISNQTPLPPSTSPKESRVRSLEHTSKKLKNPSKSSKRRREEIQVSDTNFAQQHIYSNRDSIAKNQSKHYDIPSPFSGMVSPNMSSFIPS